MKTNLRNNDKFPYVSLRFHGWERNLDGEDTDGSNRSGSVSKVGKKKDRRERENVLGFSPFFSLSTIYKRYRKNFTAVFYSKRIRAKSGDKLLHLSLLSPTMRFKSRVNASKF